MSWFEIQPLSRFTGSNAAIRRPRVRYIVSDLYVCEKQSEQFSKEIACFSYDDEHRFHPDERSLRYYYPPVLGADLSKGFDTFKQLDDTADDHLDGLLKSIIHLEQRTGTRCAADFITWRGMMTKVNKI